MGTILKHDEISPVPFFREKLFGIDPAFPLSKSVTLVGGVFNFTGGGCLNVAFDYLVNFQKRVGKSLSITVPLKATYQPEGETEWEDQVRVLQLAKDLAWKMLVSEVPFELAVDDQARVYSGQDPLIMATISTNL